MEVAYCHDNRHLISIDDSRQEDKNALTALNYVNLLRFPGIEANFIPDNNINKYIQLNEYTRKYLWNCKNF